MQAGPWNNWIRPVFVRESEGEEESGRGECEVRRGVLHFGQTCAEVDGGAENGAAMADVCRRMLATPTGKATRRTPW